MVSLKQKTEMSSRKKILATIKNNQPAGKELPSIPALKTDDPNNTVQQFIRTLGNIGGTAIEVSNWDEIT